MEEQVIGRKPKSWHRVGGIRLILVVSDWADKGEEEEWAIEILRGLNVEGKEIRIGFVESNVPQSSEKLKAYHSFAARLKTFPKLAEYKVSFLFSPGRSPQECLTLAARYIASNLLGDIPSQEFGILALGTCQSCQKAVDVLQQYGFYSVRGFGAPDGKRAGSVFHLGFVELQDELTIDWET